MSTIEYEAFFTFPDGLRWHVAMRDNSSPGLALEGELRCGDAMGMLFDSEEDARNFCRTMWPEISAHFPLTVQPDIVGDRT